MASRAFYSADVKIPFTVLYPCGRCRVCGCTDSAPCIGKGGKPCGWVDDQHTLCTHHTCIAAVGSLRGMLLVLEI